MSFSVLAPDPVALRGLLGDDYDTTVPDAHVIAQQIAYAGKLNNVPTPVTAEDLARCIQQISHDHTTGSAGAPTLTIMLSDLHWSLLDSGFFAMSPKGELLDFDLNYPNNSRFWWRLHQISPQAQYQIQLTFVPRVVGQLLGHFGPLKANRATRTRAQFLQMLCSQVDDPAGPIEFYSSELDVRQKIAPVQIKSTRSSSKQRAGQAHKIPGVGANHKGLTVKGAPIVKQQTDFVNTIIQLCNQAGAGSAVAGAMVFAAIAESDLGLVMGWDSQNPTYGGLLAGNVGYFGHLGSASSDAVTHAEINSFLKGTNGYKNAVTLSQTYQDIGQLAARVEGCVLADQSFGVDGYGQYAAENPAQVIREANAIVSAAGGGVALTAASVKGGTAGTTKTKTVDKPYYFKVNPKENYWAAMCRMAQEVNWELIVDGNRIYFDVDTDLIKQKVAVIIDRDAPTTFAWNYDWINRQVVTNFQVQVAMGLFEFTAGEVVQVVNFGPASQGSMAQPPRPGCWLISEIQHNGGDLYSTVSLSQPVAGILEPAPQTTTETKTTRGSPGTSPGTAPVLSILPSVSSGPRTPEAAYAAAKYLSSLHLTYTQGYRTLSKTGYLQGMTALDCSASVSWVLLAAGFNLPGGATWGQNPPVSGTFVTDAAAPGTKAPSVAQQILAATDPIAATQPNTVSAAQQIQNATIAAPSNKSGLVTGAGKYMTIYANADHVFIRIHPPGMPDMQGNTVNPFGPGFGFYPWDKGWPGAGCGPSPHVGFVKVHYAGT